MAATAVLTGSPSPLSPRARDGREREAILVGLEGSLRTLREGFHAFVAAPSDLASRDAFTEHLRFVAAEVNSLDWPLVAAGLSRAEALVKSAGVLGALEDDERVDLEAAIDAFADALHDDRDRERTPSSGPHAFGAVAPAPRRQTEVLSVPVVVVGPRAIADTLRARGAAEGDGFAFAVRHVARVDTAHAVLRAAEPRPEVILLDGDEPGAEQLLEDLLSDSRTDTVPVVVVGSWQAPEHAARFVALGAARCLAKPLAAGELRRMCAQSAPGTRAEAFEPLGRITLDDLGARLSAELHASLCDAAVDDRLRRKLVELGDGSAVLTVMWDAVARIRELLTAQTAGELRFRPTKRDEALPGGVSLNRSTARDKSDRAGRAERRAESTSFEGLTVLVAEEDLTTNWFLSGVLRDAGASVVDAFSSEEALACAKESLPDVVLAGLGLPNVEGRSLARAVREDVLLRDVAVVVLGSDAAGLRRAEELGEAGSGAILKGASSELVLQRLREVTRARQSLAQRLVAGGRVQGRLDDLAPCTLLRLVAKAMPNARVTFHGGDAVLEVELRDGSPVRACRTAADGTLRHGLAAMNALLSLGAGRFLVEATELPVVAELEGPLVALLAESVERVRRMQRAVSGAELLRIERIAFDTDAIAGLLAVTPEPARTVLAALVSGRSPRSLVFDGAVTLDLVERVLVDVARRNGIVHFDRGDLAVPAEPAPKALLDVTPVPEHVMPTAERVVHRVVSPPVEVVDALMASPPPPVAVPMPAASIPATGLEDDEAVVGAGTPLDLGHDQDGESFELAAPEDASWASPVARVSLTDARAESAGTDAVYEPVEDDDFPKSSAPAPIVTRASSAPRHDDRAVPKARSSAPEQAQSFERPVRGALTPILVSRLAVSQEAPRRSTTPMLASAVREAHEPAFATLDKPTSAMSSRAAKPEVEVAAPPAPMAPIAPQLIVDVVRAALAPSESRAAQPSPAAPAPAAPVADLSDVALPKAAMPSSFQPRPATEVPPKTSSLRYLAPLLFAAVGVTLAVGARWWRYQELAAKPATTQAEVVAVAGATAEPEVASEPKPPAASPSPDAPADGAAAVATASPAEEAGKPKAAPAAEEEAPVESPLTAKERRKVDADHGIVEIVAGRKDEIFVDGKRLGSGPTQRVTLSAGDDKHEVRVKMRGEERVRYVVAKPGVKLRYRIAPPWSH